MPGMNFQTRSNQSYLIFPIKSSRKPEKYVSLTFSGAPGKKRNETVEIPPYYKKSQSIRQNPFLPTRKLWVPDGIKLQNTLKTLICA